MKWKNEYLLIGSASCLIVWAFDSLAKTHSALGLATLMLFSAGCLWLMNKLKG